MFPFEKNGVKPLRCIHTPYLKKKRAKMALNHLPEFKGVIVIKLLKVCFH